MLTEYITSIGLETLSFFMIIFFFTYLIFTLLLDLFKPSYNTINIDLFNGGKLITDIPANGFIPPTDDTQERKIGETCKKIGIEEFYSCGEKLSCRKLEKDVDFNNQTLGAQSYYCLPSTKSPSCQYSHGGNLIINWSKLLDQYTLECRCTLPQFFINDKSGDCTTVTACKKFDPASALGGVKTLKCICDKYEESKMFNEGGPGCYGTSFFNSPHDPESYKSIPKIPWSMVDKTYQKYFKYLDQRSLPNPCDPDNNSAGELKLIQNIAQCLVKSGWESQYIAVTYESDYLLNNNGKKPNGLYFVLNRANPYRKPIRGYEFSVPNKTSYYNVVPYYEFLAIELKEELKAQLPTRYPYNQVEDGRYRIYEYPPISEPSLVQYKVLTQIPCITCMGFQEYFNTQDSLHISFINVLPAVIKNTLLNNTIYYSYRPLQAAITLDELMDGTSGNIFLWKGRVISITLDYTPLFSIKKEVVAHPKMFGPVLGKMLLIYNKKENRMELNKTAYGFTGRFILSGDILVPCYNGPLDKLKFDQIAKYETLTFENTDHKNLSFVEPWHSGQDRYDVGRYAFPNVMRNNGNSIVPFQANGSNNWSNFFNHPNLKLDTINDQIVMRLKINISPNYLEINNLKDDFD